METRPSRGKPRDRHRRPLGAKGAPWDACVSPRRKILVKNLPYFKYFVLGLLVVAMARHAPGEVLRLEKSADAMGSTYSIAVYGEDRVRMEAAVDAAFDEVRRLDEMLSNYRPSSEWSEVNRHAAEKPVHVSDELFRLLSACLEYSRKSEGAFDISVGPVVDLWKAALRGERVPTAEEQAKARACVGYEKIKLIPPDQVQFESPCLRIDVGSIGKGYAVDRAVDILRAEGIQSALVDAGQSSIYGMGTPPGLQAWEVHLRDPSGQVDPVVMLNENSVSTSEQTPPSLLGNQSAGHIIDPENGKPLETKFALSVVVKTGTASDALSTTLLLVGPEKGKAIVRKMPDAAAIWVAEDGATEMISTGPEILKGGKNKF